MSVKPRQRELGAERSVQAPLDVCFTRHRSAIISRGNNCFDENALAPYHAHTHLSNSGWRHPLSVYLLVNRLPFDAVWYRLCGSGGRVIYAYRQDEFDSAGCRFPPYLSYYLAPRRQQRR